MDKKIMTVLVLVSALIVLSLSMVMITGCSSKEPVAPGTSADTTSDPGFGVETDTLGEDAFTDDTGESSQTTGSATDLPGTTGPAETTAPGTVPGETTAATTPETTTGTTPETTTAPTTPTMTFEQYWAMSGEQQMEFANSFPSYDAYLAWYRQAEQEYNNKDVVEITGPIDLGDLNP